MGTDRRAAAFFDLDKTVLATSSSLALARPLLAAGLLRRSDVLRSAGAQLGYAFVAADHRRSDRIRQELSRTVNGWEVARFRDAVAGAVGTAVRPLVYLEALDLVGAHQDAGEDVVVVSASAREIVEPIAAMIGADHVIATTMAVADGRFTGRTEHYVYGPAKAAEMAALAQRHGYDLARSWAYSDSITDLPMLEVVGHPVAVNPDRALLRIARERGWEVRHFRRPVPLRPPPVRVLLALAGVAAAVGGWLWATRPRSA